MPTILFSDRASTTLAGAINASAVTLVLQSGTGALFPSPSAGQYFTLSLTDLATGNNHEIMHCTARSSDTLTVVRGQEGTSGQNWLAGDIAENHLTAASMATLVQLLDLQTQAGNYAVDTGTANAMVITLNPVPASLAALVGVPIRIKKSAAANTAAVTLTVNGLAATAVTYPLANAIGAAELVASGMLTVIFDGTRFQVQSTTFPAIVTTLGILPQTVGGMVYGSTSGTHFLDYLPTAAAHGFVPRSNGPGVAPAMTRAFDLLTSNSVPGVTNQVVPANTWAIFAICTAGGGGGAGAGGGGQGGGGGGAGGTSWGWFAVTPGDNIVLTVGAGGNGAIAGADGATGGSSSVGGFMSATGGVGGHIAASYNGGDGGNGAGGAKQIYGGDGGDGCAVANVPAGDGGASFYGGGVRGHSGILSPHGAPGAGGGGGYTAGIGGVAGHDGYIELWG